MATCASLVQHPEQAVHIRTTRCVLLPVADGICSIPIHRAEKSVTMWLGSMLLMKSAIAHDQALIIAPGTRPPFRS